MMAGVLLHGLVLGLLFSSIMKNALLAVLTAMGLTALSWVGFLSRLDQSFRGPPDRVEVLYWYLGVTLAALIASYFAFTWDSTHPASDPPDPVPVAHRADGKRTPSGRAGSPCGSNLSSQPRCPCRSRPARYLRRPGRPTGRGLDRGSPSSAI